MHRYYVHVIQSLINHDPLYSVYQIRKPFPPYATHYLTLLLLYKLFSYDTAEKAFTCGLLISFAYGFRYCATGIGPLGDRISLCIAPLFLGWAVMMGFSNYALALNFFLFALGFWVRADTGRLKYWIGYVLMVVLITVTHPVPLLVIIGLGCVHVLLGFVRPTPQRVGTFWNRNGWRLAALALTCVAFLYPLASIDRTRSASTLHDFGFHRQFLTTSLLLTGVFPYNTRSTGLLINLQRLSLYLMIGCSFILAARTFASSWKNRVLSFGDTLFLSTLALGVSLPFIPDKVNGSFYFATRMIVLLWIGLLLAASAYVPRHRSHVNVLAPLGILFSLIALSTAEVYLRPVARTLSALEQLPLPARERGLVIVGAQLNNWAKFSTQLAPDFYEWGIVLPLIRQNDIVLDSPWIEQNILPLKASPASPLWYDDVQLSDFLQADLVSVKNRLGLQASERIIVRSADYILYAGTQRELSAGLTQVLTPPEASHFRCDRQDWYLLCFRQKAQEM